MSLVDKPFKEAIRALPIRKLSWWADHRIKKMIRIRAAEMEGRSQWTNFFKQLVAVPMALVLLLTMVGGYGYASPAVVKGDFLYVVKTTIEQARYPREGTSEDRITYHLWLSERRYAEVHEILKRLDRQPLAFIPAAQAAGEVIRSEELDLILLETLQSATQNVDYAFLISNEIRDVERVRSVKEQIRSSMEKQKEFVKQVAPVLKQVKLQQKKKSRVKTLKPLPAVEISPEIIAPESSPLVETIIPPAVSPEEPTETVLPVDPELTEVPSPEEAVPVEILEVEEQEETLEDAGGFLEDRLSFQESLLERFDEVVVDADSKGNSKIRLTVYLKPLADDDEFASDRFFREALVVHFKSTQKLLQSELEEFDKKLILENPPLVETTEVEMVEVSSEPLQEPTITPDAPKEPEIDPLLPPVVEKEVNIPEETLVPSEGTPAEIPVQKETQEPAPVIPEEILPAESSISVPVVTPCEQEAREKCVDTTEEDCFEEERKDCEDDDSDEDSDHEDLNDDSNKRSEKKDAFSEVRQRAEETKIELDEVDEKLDRLQINFRSSAPDRKGEKDRKRSSKEHDSEITESNRSNG